MSEPPIDLTKVRASRALVKRKPESSKDDQQKKQPKLDKDYDRKQKLLFKWAERLLQDMGLLDALRQAKTCDEVDAIKLDDGNLTLIMAIQAVLHPSGKKPHKRCFEGFNQAMLLRFLKSRLEQFKKEQKNKLEEDEQSTAAAEEAREKREEHAQFYGDFKQYKALDSGVFVLVEDLKTESTKWEQISRTRIELLAVTRSKQDDNWGVYVRIINMDGRATCLAIPRSIINDKQGSIAGRLAGLGVDVVRDKRQYLPDFLLTTVEVAGDDSALELQRFLAVPTTGWHQLNNGHWVFVLPNTPKYAADLPAGELAIFQSEHLHLTHGIAVAGTLADWYEQIAEPFTGNSNVVLAVGVALSGPLIVWGGVPPGLFHIFCGSKRGKSLVSAIGQSVYGRPLVPNETSADPFGMSWLATANGIGQQILVRSSIGGFFEELNQGTAKHIADAAYRIANGIAKMRMRGRGLEPRLTYCVPGFSTGEEAMVEFLKRNGQRVTDGMKTRFADVPGEVQPGSVFETFSADELPGLGRSYYPLLGQLYGAVGDAWLQVLVDMGPEQIQGEVQEHQQEFRACPQVQALYQIALPYQRSVIDRFATVAAACRMAINKIGLPWDLEDTDAAIEACVSRWAGYDKRLDRVAAAIIAFMHGQTSWQGTATELLQHLNGAIASAKALGRWLNKPENLQRLNAVSFEITLGRDSSTERNRLIRIDRIGRTQ